MTSVSEELVSKVCKGRDGIETFFLGYSFNFQTFLSNLALGEKITSWFLLQAPKAHINRLV